MHLPEECSLQAFIVQEIARLLGRCKAILQLGLAADPLLSWNRDRHDGYRTCIRMDSANIPVGYTRFICGHNKVLSK